MAEIYTFSKQGTDEIVTMLRDYKRRLVQIEQQLALSVKARVASSYYVQLEEDIDAADHDADPMTAESGYGFRIYSTVIDPDDGPINMYAVDPESNTGSELKNAKILIYNYSAIAYSADDIVCVTQNRGEGKYVITSGGDSSIVPFVLTEDVGDTTSGEASANLLDFDGVALSPTQSVTVLDNLGIFSTGANTKKGYAIKKGGEYHILQLECA